MYHKYYSAARLAETFGVSLRHAIVEIAWACNTLGLDQFSFSDAEHHVIAFMVLPKLDPVRFLALSRKTDEYDRLDKAWRQKENINRGRRSPSQPYVRALKGAKK